MLALTDILRPHPVIQILRRLRFCNPTACLHSIANGPLAQPNDPSERDRLLDGILGAPLTPRAMSGYESMLDPQSWTKVLELNLYAAIDGIRENDPNISAGAPTPVFTHLKVREPRLICADLEVPHLEVNVCNTSDFDLTDNP